MIAIARMIREDCSRAAADEHLSAFRGFHLDSSDPRYRARPWEKIRLADIRPADVVGLDVAEMVFMMRVAMEIEDPILEYSHSNAEGFRRLLPMLGRFMGRNDAEAAYAAAHGLPWCESPWCAEERRHGSVFAKAIERLTRKAPTRSNPNVPRVAPADEEEALRHLRSREAAEWASSSTYVVMAAHASGTLHTLMRNVARDEIKHLCILAAADAYLLGPRRWVRFAALVKIGLENYRGQRRHRSDGGQIGANAITAVEVVLAHLAMERRVRNWIARVPVRRLALLFDCAPDDREGDEAVVRGRRDRRSLSRWPAAARRRALAQLAVEDGGVE